MLFLCGFRRHVRQFFGAVLDLARLSGAWCFPAGRCLGHGVFLPAGVFFEAAAAAAAAAATQVTVAAEAAATAVRSRMCRKMLFFRGFRRHVRQFFGAVLDLARLSGAWCFPAGRCLGHGVFLPAGVFFEAAATAAAAAAAATAAVGNCFLEAVQHAAAAAPATEVTVAAEAAATAVGSRMCRKMLFFCGFRRHVRQFFNAVLDLARLSNVVFCGFRRHGSSRQLFFRSCATCSSSSSSNRSNSGSRSSSNSSRQQNVPKNVDTLGSFLVRFWT